MPSLTYRAVAPDAYRISFDGVEVGSIAMRTDHVQQHDFWRWAVDALPLKYHGGSPPAGDAESFPAAMDVFKTGFTKWHEGFLPGVWEMNRAYLRRTAERGRYRAMTDGPIFQLGDVVQLSDFGKARSKFPDRRGVVVGISKSRAQIRVHWSGLTLPELVHTTLLQLADRPSAAGKRKERGSVESPTKAKEMKCSPKS
jgi:hypothetical protein